MHVLYHVPDIRRAIGELGRVLRSSGIALVATNGTQHHQRLRDVFDEIVTDLSGEKVDPVLSSDRRFRLEDGQAMLEVEFKSVARYGLPRELRLTELAPVLRYLQSVRSFHESELPANVDWDEVVARVAALIQNDIAHEGSFHNPIYEGVFVCRRPRAT
jgi:hypothetical protein